MTPLVARHGLRGDAPGRYILYRILTERRNVAKVKALLVANDVDYTIFFGEGAWHGAPERSMAIELANQKRATVVRLARAIRDMNAQKAVLLQKIPISCVLLRKIPGRLAR